MGLTSPEQPRRPQTFVRRARRALCWVGGLLFVASFLPVWTGLTDGVYFHNPGTKEPYHKPLFETRAGPDGRPHIVGKTTFWRSDALQDLVAWFDIVEHFD